MEPPDDLGRMMVKGRQGEAIGGQFDYKTRLRHPIEQTQMDDKERRDGDVAENCECAGWEFADLSA